MALVKDNNGGLSWAAGASRAEAEEAAFELRWWWSSLDVGLHPTLSVRHGVTKLRGMLPIGDRAADNDPCCQLAAECQKAGEGGRHRPYTASSASLVRLILVRTTPPARAGRVRRKDRADEFFGVAAGNQFARACMSVPGRRRCL